jgi:hypothetical protein
MTIQDLNFGMEGKPMEYAVRCRPHVHEDREPSQYKRTKVGPIFTLTAGDTHLHAGFARTPEKLKKR